MRAREREIRKERDKEREREIRLIKTGSFVLPPSLIFNIVRCLVGFKNICLFLSGFLCSIVN